jgi:hypothetical protein
MIDYNFNKEKKGCTDGKWRLRMEEQKSVKDETQVTESNVAVEKAASRETLADYDKPHAATLAAIEFQIASLLNDHLSTVNWPGREPIVVNEPGGLAKKLETLSRIAKAHFLSRGDVDDVLNQTIDEYGLWKWANPSGFWTAFKRDMIDAAKAASEAKRIPLEQGGRTFSDGIRNRRDSYEWTRAGGTRKLENEIARKWSIERSGEIYTCEPSVSHKWEIAQVSVHPLDRLICEVVRQVAADEGYMDELASTNREAAKLTRFVAEIRSLTGCSQAEAYRLLGDFKRRYSSRRKKS